MIGALAGDIIGSVYEFNNIKTKELPLFCIESSYTDDSIMTIAVADWLLHGGDLVRVMQYYGSKYPFPMGGYGARLSVKNFFEFFKHFWKFIKYCTYNSNSLYLIQST